MVVALGWGPLASTIGGIMAATSLPYLLLLAITPLGIEHDANVNATPLGCDDGIEERRVGEEEHFDANGFLGLGDGFEDWLGGVVG